jgi:tetratricopeptide (TPR) repeat protein
MTAGDLYYQIQRLDEAIEFYEKANRLRPDDNEPLIKLGNTYFDAKRYEDAERTYAAVLKRTPNDVNVRTDLGLTFFLRNPRDLDRAIKEYVAALAIEPEHEITLQNLAVAYKEKGDVQNLRQTMDRLGRVNPSNPFLAQNGQ